MERVLSMQFPTNQASKIYRDNQQNPNLGRNLGQKVAKFGPKSFVLQPDLDYQLNINIVHHNMQYQKNLMTLSRENKEQVIAFADLRPGSITQQ